MNCFQLHNAIIHKLNYNENSESVVAELSLDTVNNNRETIMLADELNRSISTKARIFTSTNGSELTGLLTDFLNEKLSFTELSCCLSTLIAETLSRASCSSVPLGALLLTETLVGGRKYLCLGIIPESTSLELINPLRNISSSRMNELAANITLNTSDITAGVLIDLTLFNECPNSTKVVTMSKPSRKSDEHTYLNMLGLTRATDSNSEAKMFVQTIDDFLTTSELSPSSQKMTKNQIASYLSKHGHNSVDVDDLLSKVTEIDTLKLKSFIQQAGFEIRSKISVTQNSAKSLRRISGSANGMTLSFNTLLVGESIFYDKSKDTLVINNVPESLKKELIKLQQSYDQNNHGEQNNRT